MATQKKQKGTKGTHTHTNLRGEVGKKRMPPAGPGHQPKEKTPQGIIHDLEECRIQLEKQNEELGQAYDALGDREEELASIYENAPLIMLLVDNEWKIQKTDITAPVDKAMEMGINWWQQDPYLSDGKKAKAVDDLQY